MTKDRKDLARRMAQLFRQPRIPGVTREARHTALIPNVAAALRDRAASRGVSFSRAVAEIISAAVGYDAATGDRTSRRVIVPPKGKAS